MSFTLYPHHFLFTESPDSEGGAGEFSTDWLAQFLGEWVCLGLVKVLVDLGDFPEPMLSKYSWIRAGGRCSS